MAHPLVRKWQISPTLRRMAAAILVAVMVAAVQAKTPPIVVHVRSIAATSATTSSTAITTRRSTTTTGRSYDSLVDCVADLRSADLNGDELVSDTEYIALVNSVVTTYGYCYPLAIDIVEQFREASCLCQDYYDNLNATQQALVPTCTCSGVPGDIALPNTIYPAEYTRRICEGLQLLLATTVCPPTVAPVAALPTAAGGSATPTPSSPTSTTTTNAPAIPEETDNDNDIDMEGQVNSDADKGRNGVGIAFGILIPLLLVTLGIYYRRYHVNGRAILGKHTEDSTDNNRADNWDHARSRSASDGGDDDTTTAARDAQKSPNEDTDRTVTLDDSDEESNNGMFNNNNWVNALNGLDHSDGVLEINRVLQGDNDDDNDYDDDETEDLDDDEHEEEDGFDPGSLEALNYSRPSSVATVSPSPPSSPSSKPARKKKKKTPTLQSAKRVRAEYKKKMQNQRQCMQAIPERNLTAI